MKKVNNKQLLECLRPSGAGYIESTQPVAPVYCLYLYCLNILKMKKDGDDGWPGKRQQQPNNKKTTNRKEKEKKGQKLPYTVIYIYC